VIRNLLNSLLGAVVATAVVMIIAWVLKLALPHKIHVWIKVVEVILLVLIWAPIVLDVLHKLINLITL